MCSGSNSISDEKHHVLLVLNRRYPFNVYSPMRTASSQVLKYSLFLQLVSHNQLTHKGREIEQKDQELAQKNQSMYTATRDTRP